MGWAEDIDLPAIFQAISSTQEALEVVEQLNETISFGNSALSRMQEEAIATVVAVANRCTYSALTHGGFFRRHTGDGKLASHLLNDYSSADLDPRDLLMLDFAVRLTRNQVPSPPGIWRGGGEPASTKKPSYPSYSSPVCLIS